jgi:hypothetical protein
MGMRGWSVKCIWDRLPNVCNRRRRQKCCTTGNTENTEGTAALGYSVYSVFSVAPHVSNLS